MVAAGKPALFGVGFLLVVHMPIVLSLTNPQSYDPQICLTNSLLSVLAALFLAASLATVLPTDDARRRRWILTATHREFLAVLEGRRIGRLTDQEASFRAADRLAQLANLTYADDGAKAATLAHALQLAEVTFSARWVQDAVRGAPAGDVLAALAALDPTRRRRGALRGRARPVGGRSCTEPNRWFTISLVRVGAPLMSWWADLSKRMNHPFGSDHQRVSCCC